MRDKYEILEKVDYVRRYAEYLEGGEIKTPDLDVMGNFIDIEIHEYHEILHWYFVVENKKDLPELVRYAICEVGIDPVTVCVRLKNGGFHCETFFGKRSLDSRFAWRLLEVDED